jgi:hypothetical protein
MQHLIQQLISVIYGQAASAALAKIAHKNTASVQHYIYNGLPYGVQRTFMSSL